MSLEIPKTLKNVKNNDYYSWSSLKVMKLRKSWHFFLFKILFIQLLLVIPSSACITLS